MMRQRVIGLLLAAVVTAIFLMAMSRWAGPLTLWLMSLSEAQQWVLRGVGFGLAAVSLLLAALRKEPGKIWFAAKQYGFGWGLPVAWQGWVVLVGFVVLLSMGTALLPAHPVGFSIYLALLCAVLTLVCYLKGETPGWRWGKK
ncbi:MAG: hypothetical protein V4463_04490 [Pseudomonadota bacterium]